MRSKTKGQRSLGPSHRGLESALFRRIDVAGKAPELERVPLARRTFVIEMQDTRRELLLMLLVEERQEDRVEELAALVPRNAAISLRPALLASPTV